MKARILLATLSLALFALLSGGCRCGQSGAAGEATPEIRIMRTALPIRVDGKLDEPVWQEAPVYEMHYYPNEKVPPETAKHMASAPGETGRFQLAIDDRYLYLAVRFTERDVCDFNNTEQDRLYANGDIAELFLFPLTGTPYFEFYVTPTGRRTSYIFPNRSLRRSAIVSFNIPMMPDIKAAAQIDGTLNDHSDFDRGWTAELAVPLAEIAGYGTPLTAEQPWRIMVSRYNYSHQFSDLALYSYPKLPYADFHLVDYYADLKIMPAK